MSSSEALILGLFCRSFGFFLFSPLFSKIPIPRMVRFGMALSIAFLLAPLIAQRSEQMPSSGSLLFLFLIKETVLGYLLGLLFSLILESAALAGQLVGTLAGFSATELFDPLSSSSYPLWSKVFTLFVAVLMFTFDLHHELIKVLYDSFSLFPFSGSLFSENTVHVVLEGVQRFFQFTIDYAALPLLTLGALILLLAIASKMLPDFPVFWIGLPIQILIGTAILILTIEVFPLIVERAFITTKQLIEKIFAIFLFNY